MGSKIVEQEVKVDFGTVLLEMTSINIVVRPDLVIGERFLKGWKGSEEHRLRE